MVNGDSVLALDVGGTTCKAWVCDPSGAVLTRLERPTAIGDSGAATIAQIRSLCRELATPELRGAAVVVPGLVDSAKGIARYAANLGWSDVPLRDLLQADLGVPVVLDHDVRAAGTAEALLGTARGHQHALVVPIGTGIAAAVVTGGEVISGATGLAGEIGHLPVHPTGEPCSCGQHGCTEVYASAAGIARRYLAATGTNRTAEEIAALVGTDPVADRVWGDGVEALALALVSATLLVDPDLIVIGGGLAHAGDVLFRPLAKRLQERLTFRDAPPLRPAAFGIDAGRIGAAVLAWRVAGRPEVPAGWSPADVFAGAS